MFSIEKGVAVDYVGLTLTTATAFSIEKMLNH